MASRTVPNRNFVLLFLVMLIIAAGNTALQSVLPALGRSLGVADNAVAAAFSVSALLWVVSAPFWANRSDQYGRRPMVLLGLGGFTLSLFGCGLFLAAGINGVIAPVVAFGAFIVARMLYGGFGSAAPPAVQAIVASNTTRDERTKALTLLASAFGLGTILGPTFAPLFVFDRPWPGGPHIGLASPAFVFGLVGVAMLVTVARLLPRDMPDETAHGAAASYPSIGGQGTGASVAAALKPHRERIGYFDPRVRAWMIVGLVMGHAQAMTSQAIGFLVIDRLHVSPVEAVQPTGLVLVMGAGAALLAQWGLIPLLNLKPRTLVLAGLVVGAAGCAATGLASSLYGIAMAFALASLGFGFMRPGFTAGASLAVDADLQGSVAGKVTSVNGAGYVLGPSIGVGLYQFVHPLPYLVACAAMLAVAVYAWAALSPSDRAPPAFPEQ